MPCRPCKGIPDPIQSRRVSDAAAIAEQPAEKLLTPRGCSHDGRAGGCHATVSPGWYLRDTSAGGYPANLGIQPTNPAGTGSCLPGFRGTVCGGSGQVTATSGVAGHESRGDAAVS